MKKRTELPGRFPTTAGNMARPFPPDRLQMIRRTDARLHEQLRRADRARCNDYLATGVHDLRHAACAADNFNPRRARAFDHHAQRQRMRLDREVWARTHRLEKTTRRGRTPRIELRQLVITE